MEYILWYIILNLFLFVVLLFFQYIVPLKRNTLIKNKAVYYIIRKYDLKTNAEKIRKLAKLVVFANSVILSIPIYIIIFIDIKYWIALLIALIIFITLFLVIYNAIGKHLKKKGW